MAKQIGIPTQEPISIFLRPMISWNRAPDGSSYPSSQCKYNIQQQLSVDTGHPNILQHDRQIIARNIIARKFAEPCHGHVEHQAVSSGPGFEEDTNVEEGPQRGHSLSFERFGNFFHF